MGLGRRERRMGMKRAAAVCGVGAVLLAGCGSSQKVSTVTVTTTASGAASTGVNAPAPSTQAPVSTSANGNKLLAEVKMGVPVKDDGVSFKVLSAKTVASIPVPYDTPVHPLPGARLVLVKVKTKNLGAVAVDPFCGDTGAVLGDPAHRNWEINGDQTLSVAPNGAGICDDIQPGLATTIPLVFDVPKSAHVTYIALWNGDSNGPDPEGQTYDDVDLP
jgi:hypothetical protein